MVLSVRQQRFLCALDASKNKPLSINQIGRQYYKTDMSVYTVLEKMQKEGYINVFKDLKLLRVEVTRKGRNVINKLF